MGNLCPAGDIAITLNIAADITNGALVDAKMLLCVFANVVKDEVVLEYDGHFHCHGDGHVIYVRRKARPGCNEGTNQRFDLMELTRLATAVRFYIGMDNGVRARLVCVLAKRKLSKQIALDVTPR